MFEQAKKELAGVLAAKTGLSEEKVLALLEVPPQSALGDLSFPCFELSKLKKKNPAHIAVELSEELDLSGTLFERAESKGPYLNFFLRLDQFAGKVLAAIFEERDQFGASNEGRGKKVLVDYSSPNIAKPFHIGHLRSTIIGASLCRIFKFLGYDVIGVNHLGDWGTQFGMVMAAWDESGSEELLEKDPIAYLLQLYIDYNKRAEADEAARDKAREWFKRLEDGDERATGLWKRFRNLSLEAFKKVYDRLGIGFDYYWGESFYNDKMEFALDKLKSKNLLEKGKDGAVVVDLGKDMPPALIRKSDGATLYITRDLAAAIYRFEKFQPEEMLYVVGRPQELHFQQLFLLLSKLGYEWQGRLKHVKFGHIQGLSTRRGEIIFLEQVLDEAKERASEKIEDNIKAGKLSQDIDRDRLAEQVGISAILVNDFKNHRERDMVFDWDQALNFEGETGPYLQYTHARICGILRKATKKADSKVDFKLLVEPETKEVVKKLSLFPTAVREARSQYEPFIICSYLFELTTVFNQFYNKCRVLGSGEAESARLLLVSSVRQVIAQGLKLLGATPLEQM
jgi:arginyl-tRNA synthetase